MDVFLWILFVLFFIGRGDSGMAFIFAVMLAIFGGTMHPNMALRAVFILPLVLTLAFMIFERPIQRYFPRIDALWHRRRPSPRS